MILLSPKPRLGFRILLNPALRAAPTSKSELARKMKPYFDIPIGVGYCFPEGMQGPECSLSDGTVPLRMRRSHPTQAGHKEEGGWHPGVGGFPALGA